MPALLFPWRLKFNLKGLDFAASLLPLLNNPPPRQKLPPLRSPEVSHGPWGWQSAGTPGCPIPGALWWLCSCTSEELVDVPLTPDLSAHTHWWPLHLSGERPLWPFLFCTLGGSFFPFTGPSRWCLASSSSASLIPSECSRNLIPLQFTFPLRTPEEFWTGLTLCSRSMHSATSSPHPSLGASAVYHQTWGLPHRPSFFVEKHCHATSKASQKLRGLLEYLLLSLPLFNPSSTKTDQNVLCPDRSFLPGLPKWFL